MYVGTYLNRREGFLAVSERINGQRVMTQYPLVLEYLVPDSMGSEMGIDGKRLKKIELKDIGEYYSHKKIAAEGFLPTYELNFNLTNKVLYKYYKGCEAPVLHKMFFDIEVDYDPAIAGDMNTLVTKTPCAINAVSMYMDWLDKTITLALKPSSLSFEEAKKITDSLEDTYLFDDEKQLLDTMIKLFDDADVISGWNSDFFDIPYIIGRITKLFDQKKTAELCLWGQLPVAKEVETYGRLAINYSLVGKWSVDYMQLYKKHTPNEHESYSLDNIAFEELGDRKVKYEGTLTNLYFDDFKLFLEYNKQDTNLLARLDKKLNYINIHNRQAHSILVTLDATMGTVAWFDQAVINRAHDSNLYVPDRVEGKNMLWEGVRPPGAFVQDPVVGMHEWISDTDLNSLYPSTIRCLNMSPETIWGQIELTYTMPYLWQKIETKGLWKNKEKRIPSWTEAWGGDEMFGTLEYQMVMNQTEDMLTLATETGEKMDISAKDLYEVIFSDDSNVCLSAFGTLFRTDVQGIVPKILSEWYADRKTMKKKAYNYRCMKEGISILPSLSEMILKHFDKTKVTSKEIDYDTNKLKEMVKANAVDDLITFMYDNGLTIVDNIIEPLNKSYYEEREAYWDLEQYLRKINLNSSYGALLNSGSTFYDFRLGASTTASGRKIVQHMASKLNEIAVGEYKHKGGITVYGDTDSCGKDTLTTINSVVKTIEDFYNEVNSEEIIEKNNSLVKFVDKKYLTPSVNKNLELEQKEVVSIMKHKVKKEMFEIEVEGNKIEITEDHSIMVVRQGKLLAIKPKEIDKDDLLCYIIQ